MRLSKSVVNFVINPIKSHIACWNKHLSHQWKYWKSNLYFCNKAHRTIQHCLLSHRDVREKKETNFEEKKIQFLIFNSSFNISHISWNAWSDPLPSSNFPSTSRTPQTTWMSPKRNIKPSLFSGFSWSPIALIRAAC